MSLNTCPCQQQQPDPRSYEQCCKPFHSGLPAIQAEPLMRSRFSAYAMGLASYLKQTWHSSTCPQSLSPQPDDQWLKLDIVSSSDKSVHFKAFFIDEQGFQCLEEKSKFVIENERLVYLNGETNMLTVTLNRNDECLCGSGKKFKKCCHQSC